MLMLILVIIGMQPTYSNHNITKLEVQTGILEVERHKVADSNEHYDIITPISILIRRYENARKKYHRN